MSATIGRRIEGGLPARVEPMIASGTQFLVGNKPLLHGDVKLMPGDPVPQDLLDNLPRPETMLQLRRIVPAPQGWSLAPEARPVQSGDVVPGVPGGAVQTGADDIPTAQALEAAAAERAAQAEAIAQAKAAEAKEEAKLLAAAKRKKAAAIKATGLKTDAELAAEQPPVTAEAPSATVAVDEGDEPPDDE